MKKVCFMTPEAPPRHCPATVVEALDGDERILRLRIQHPDAKEPVEVERAYRSQDDREAPGCWHVHPAE